MKKNLKKFAVHLMVGAALFAGSLHAEDEDKQEQERVRIGERSLPKTEQLAIQEERAERFEEQKEDQKKATARSVEGANFYSTHAGAYHKPYAVSLLGDTVELEDGSIWAVKKGDRYKTMDWLTSDSLVITPNHNFFSSYTYRITNINTGKSIEVDLALGPIYNSIYTHWIAAIDYYNGQICLEDGSVWDVSGFYQSTLNKMLMNDTIIIGIDDSLLGSTNILINVNLNNYVSADCVY